MGIHFWGVIFRGVKLGSVVCLEKGDDSAYKGEVRECRFPADLR